MTGVPAVRMTGIARSFGSLQALRGADLSLEPGEIHALLGENGAGKSTLMHILFGMIAPDAGAIEVGGRPARFASPRDAMNAGIGMVHQHFSQVPRMTVAENVALGRPGFRFSRGAAATLVRDTGAATGLVLDPHTLAADLPVGLKQRLEIVKALARAARVLILDEPTASLIPSEVQDLFASLRRLAAGGLAVVLITHKLREVLDVADRVTVLRQGSVAATGPASGYDRATLATAMVGQGDAHLPEDIATAPVSRSEGPRPSPALEVRGLTIRRPGGKTIVDAVSFEVGAGEIVGIAAVEGNGQRELMRAVAGIDGPSESVSVNHGGTVGFIPEDRQNEGLILDFSTAENLALTGASGLWLQRRYLEDRVAVAIDEFGIQTQDARLPVRSLSGGNQQKVVLARVLGEKPVLLVAENPTRGLDIRATADVHAALRNAALGRGLGVLFYSTDLDEVLALSHRIGVMSAGRWTWVDRSSGRDRLGAAMLGVAS